MECNLFVDVAEVTKAVSEETKLLIKVKIFIIHRRIGSKVSVIFTQS